MDTPFAPKTHISKRIKLWAVILLVAVILASGLAMLTGGKTRLFKGSLTEQEGKKVGLKTLCLAIENANWSEDGRMCFIMGKTYKSMDEFKDEFKGIVNNTCTQQNSTWDDAESTCTGPNGETAKFEDVWNSIINSVSKGEKGINLLTPTLQAQQEEKKEATKAEQKAFCDILGKYGEFNESSNKCSIKNLGADYVNEEELKGIFKNAFKAFCTNTAGASWNGVNATCTTTEVSITFEQYWQNGAPGEISIASPQDPAKFETLCQTLENTQWNNTSKQCTFNGKPISNEYMLQLTVREYFKNGCTQSGGTWTNDICTPLDGAVFKFEDTWKQIVGGYKPQGTTITGSEIAEFKAICEKIEGTEWRNEVCALNDKEYANEEQLKEGAKEIFKNGCEQAKATWNATDSSCTSPDGSFKFDDLWLGEVKGGNKSQAKAQLSTEKQNLKKLCGKIGAIGAIWTDDGNQCKLNGISYSKTEPLKNYIENDLIAACTQLGGTWNYSGSRCETFDKTPISIEKLAQEIAAGLNNGQIVGTYIPVDANPIVDNFKIPDNPQLTVSIPIEIQAGAIPANASADVLKLKFQATEADIIISSVKITTQLTAGTAPVTDFQSFKLMEGANTIGSSAEIGPITTLISTPSFTIVKGTPRELTLNVTAKSGAVKDNTYLFRIQVAGDIISTSTTNILLNPAAPLSSKEFKIAIAGAGAGSTPTAPTVSVTASPSTTQTAGQKVIFTITVNNGPGMYNYTLDLGDGKTVKTLNGATSATATFDNIYTEAKTYTVKASVNMVINGVSQIISAPDLAYAITAVATAATPSADILALQNQLATMQQQLANSQNAQSTAQIDALNKQIADLVALNAAKEADAKAKSSKTKAKAKTPVETPEMWGPTPTQAPVYVPPAPPAPSPEMISLQNQIAALQQSAGQMYASAPSLGYSQKLVKAPDKSNTGPEVLVYFIAVGAANAAWWIRRKVRK